MGQRPLVKFAIALCVAVGLTSLSCASKTAGIPVSQLPLKFPVEDLDRSEYTIGERTVGQDCATVVVLFPFPIWFVASNELGARAYRFKTAETVARDGSIYRALENAPDADFLLGPRIKTDSVTFGPWGGRTCYELKARSASLKTDDQLPQEDLDVDVSIQRSTR